MMLGLTFISCSDDQENYLGSWNAEYIEINGSQPFFCASGWAEIFKMDDGSMRVELGICDEEFFATTNSYNFDLVEFGFTDQPASDIEIVVEGSIEYIGGGEIQLNMFRDIYIDGFFTSGKDYYCIFN